VRQALLCQFVGAGECLTILEAAVDEFPGAAGGVLFALLDCVKRLLAQLIREVHVHLPHSTSYVRRKSLVTHGRGFLLPD
jgi:hypothetical protein